MGKKSVLHIFLLVSFIGAVIWSAVHPVNWGTWFAEVAPAIVGIGILVWSYRKFRFASLVYLFVWLSAIIMTIGGHYSYEHVPLFDTIKEAFHLRRNDFDRLGHMFQGAVVALLARELLVRKGGVKNRKWLFAIALSIALANSAVYEILEFAVTASQGKSSDELLGAQGDIWDSQWDMLSALAGAIVGLVLFGKYHDRKMGE